MLFRRSCPKVPSLPGKERGDRDGRAVRESLASPSGRPASPTSPTGGAGKPEPKIPLFSGNPAPAVAPLAVQLRLELLPLGRRSVAGVRLRGQRRVVVQDDAELALGRY